MLIATDDRLLLAVLLHNSHDARLAFGGGRLGARPVRPVPDHLILCETIRVYYQLATSPEPSHVVQGVARPI